MFFLLAIILWLAIFLACIYLIMELYTEFLKYRKERQKEKDLERFWKMYRINIQGVANYDFSDTSLCQG